MSFSVQARYGALKTEMEALRQAQIDDHGTLKYVYILYGSWRCIDGSIRSCSGGSTSSCSGGSGGSEFFFSCFKY